MKKFHKQFLVFALERIGSLGLFLIFYNIYIVKDGHKWQLITETGSTISNVLVVTGVIIVSISVYFSRNNKYIEAEEISKKFTVPVIGGLIVMIATLSMCGKIMMHAYNGLAILGLYGSATREIKNTLWWNSNEEE